VMELLTVLLLTYNHEQTIGRAIESILAQKTRFPYVVHVLEDCSTDQTPAICRQYKEKYPEQIELFLNPQNLGVMENFKQGLMRVRTPYFAFLEGDDYWCGEDKLQKQVDLLERHPDCSICGHNVLCRDMIHQKEWYIVDKAKYEIKERYTIHDKIPIHPSSRVYRNIIDFSTLPNFMVLDSHLLLLYLTQGDLCYLDEVLSVYHITETGFWSGRTKKQKALSALELRYKANQYFQFKYDYRYYVHSKMLKLLKMLLGVRLGWFCFYHLEKQRIAIKYLFK